MEQQRKKIFYVITKSNWGGAQKYVHDLSGHFVKEAHDVRVVLGGSGTLVQKLTESGIGVISLSPLQRDIGIFREVRALFALYKILKTEKPDIVHLNSSKAGGLGTLAARLAKVKKIIFTAHGWSFKERRGILSRIIIAKLSWLTVLFSHNTIVVSQDDKKRARWMPFVQHKIHMIHNGIAPLTFLDKKESRIYFRKETNIEKNSKTFWIGTVAELHKNKGLEYLLGGCALLKKRGIPFVLIVMGSGEEEQILKRYVAEKELNNNVFFLGFVSGAAEYLPGLDVFILPSIKEGLPYVLLEAGHAQSAVVATNVGGIPEIIGDMRSGLLIKPRRADEIADAIVFMYKNPSKRKSFSEALKKTVAEEFALNRMIEKTRVLYEV